MQLQYRENPYPKSYSREGTDQDGTRKDKSSKGVEDTDKSQGCGKFPVKITRSRLSFLYFLYFYSHLSFLFLFSFPIYFPIVYF